MTIEQPFLYQEQLSSTYHGLALWKPNPEGLYDRVTIGDVGYVYEGAFIRMFNVTLPWDDVSNKTLGDPFHYDPLSSDSFTIRDENFGKSDRYSRGVSREDNAHNIHAKTPDQAEGVTYECRGQGALLSLPRGGLRQVVIQTKIFEQYAGEHVARWFHWSKIRGLPVERMEDLVLVCGCTLVTSWAAVAFDDFATGAQVSLASRTLKNGGASFVWSNIYGTVERHDSQLDPSVSYAPKNQCVFIKSTRAKPDKFWAKLFRSPSITSNTRAQHSFNANKDDTRSTTTDRPNHVATSPRISRDSLLPGTPGSSDSSFHPGAPPARPPPNRIRTTPSNTSSNMTVLGLMEMAAGDSECLFRLATDGSVSAGNLEGLIYRVITDIEDPSRNDLFRATFLTIYQLFATSERLFHILKRRFESSELDPARSRYPILLFIESWLKKGFADEDLKCTSMIKKLVLPLVDSETISEKMRAEAKEIVRLIEDPDYVRLRQPKNCTALRSEPAKRPQGVMPADLAAALTVVEGDRFKCITYWDHVNFTRCPPNVWRIEVFNIVHDLVKVWVQITVLESDFLDERMEMYEEWVNTAKACRALNNFSTTSAIVLALTSPLVMALALTCESKAKPDLYALAEELTPTDGVYQNTLRKVATRDLIPCLDLHLSTLNSSFAHFNPIVEVDGHPLIDLKYCSKIAEQIDSLVQYSPPRTHHTTRPDLLAYVEYSLKSCRSDDVLRTAEKRSARLADQERVFDAQRKMKGFGFAWSPPRRRK